MYKILKATSELTPRIAADVERLKIILNNSNILYTKSRYYYEFVFVDIRWDRSFFLKLDRIKRQLKNDIRFNKTEDNKLGVFISRWSGFLGK